MPTVPRTSNSVANFPLLLTIPDCDYIANSFMSRNSRKCVAKHCVLDGIVGVADTTSENLHKNLEILMSATIPEYKTLNVTYLSCLRQLKRNIFEGERCAFGFEHRDLVFFGEILSHCCSSSRSRSEARLSGVVLLANSWGQCKYLCE